MRCEGRRRLGDSSGSLPARSPRGPGAVAPWLSSVCPLVVVLLPPRGLGRSLEGRDWDVVFKTHALVAVLFASRHAE